MGLFSIQLNLRHVDFPNFGGFSRVQTVPSPVASAK